MSAHHAFNKLPSGKEFLLWMACLYVFGAGVEKVASWFNQARSGFDSRYVTNSRVNELLAQAEGTHSEFRAGISTITADVAVIKKDVALMKERQEYMLKALQESKLVRR